MSAPHCSFFNNPLFFFLKHQYQEYRHFAIEGCSSIKRFFLSTSLWSVFNLIACTGNFYCFVIMSVWKPKILEDYIMLASLFVTGLLTFSLQYYDEYIRPFFRRKQGLRVYMAGSVLVIMIGVVWNVRVKPSSEGIASELCLGASCLCLSHLFDSSVDFGFIDFLVIEAVMRASTLYHFHWRFWIVLSVTLFLIFIKALVKKEGLSPSPVEPEKGVELRDTEYELNEARARVEVLEAKRSLLLHQQQQHQQHLPQEQEQEQEQQQQQQHQEQQPQQQEVELQQQPQGVEEQQEQHV